MQVQRETMHNHRDVMALEHAAARRLEDAQLCAEMQEDYDCKLVYDRRKWFTAVQGNPRVFLMFTTRVGLKTRLKGMKSIRFEQSRKF
jgi:hypothetical protein